MKLDKSEIQKQIETLKPWFHNINLNGIATAPDHFLGDYPRIKFERFAHALPQDLTGKSVLDIGCNAGFYSIEMKKRGASRVLGIDADQRYLAQARLAANVVGVDIEFREMSVYEVAHLKEKFDIVLFMGVLYHLRHPLLALDLLYENVVKDTLVFQSMQRGSKELPNLQQDYDFWQTDIFEQSSFPKMYFIEHRYAGDPTNWWVPNRAGMEAMLRSAGFDIIEHPEDEVYICNRSATVDHKTYTIFSVQKT